jgi:HK97 family phage prohead protease
MHDVKHITTTGEFKADGPTGSLRAVISTFDVVDMDGDVVAASAFTDGQAVPLVWAHDWSRPIGKGAIRVEANRAVFDGQLFLDTADGVNAFNTIKGMGDLQEYSWGFRILDAEPVSKGGGEARCITKAEVFEASPVLVGAAGRGRTRTLSLKGEGLDYDTHAAQTLGAVEELVERTRSGFDRRQEGRSGSDPHLKRGRPISEARRVRMAGVRDGLRGHADEIDTMLIETAEPDAPKRYEPDGGSPEAKNAPAPDADLVAIREEHARRMARYGVDEHGLIR